MYQFHMAGPITFSSIKLLCPYFYVSDGWWKLFLQDEKNSKNPTNHFCQHLCELSFSFSVIQTLCSYIYIFEEYCYWTECAARLPPWRAWTHTNSSCLCWTEAKLNQVLGACTQRQQSLCYQHSRSILTSVALEGSTASISITRATLLD